MPENQPADIEWKDGVPVSTRFDDPYYSLDNGLAETRHVFLAGNDLPDRFGEGFHIAELGFGTGLNMLCTLQAWIESGQKTPLWFTSFEAFPMNVEDLSRAIAAFPELHGLSRPLLTAWSGGETQIDTPHLHARIIIGDACETLADWQGAADAWFLDGFAPAQNPELWQPDLMAEVARHTRPGGSFATYTAAGHVRRALDAAGFEVERRKGFGRKRHMSVGVLR